jgi:hypothetical protein
MVVHNVSHTMHLPDHPFSALLGSSNQVKCSRYNVIIQILAERYLDWRRSWKGRCCRTLQIFAHSDNARDQDKSSKMTHFVFVSNKEDYHVLLLRMQIKIAICMFEIIP